MGLSAMPQSATYNIQTLRMHKKCCVLLKNNNNSLSFFKNEEYTTLKSLENNKLLEST